MRTLLKYHTSGAAYPTKVSYKHTSVDAYPTKVSYKHTSEAVYPTKVHTSGAAYPTTVSYSVEVVEDKFREFGPTVITSVTSATFFFVAGVAYFCLNSLGWRLAFL